MAQKRQLNLSLLKCKLILSPFECQLSFNRHLNLIKVYAAQSWCPTDSLSNVLTFYLLIVTELPTLSNMFNLSILTELPTLSNECLINVQ